MRFQEMDASRYAAYFICISCGKKMVLSRAEPPIYADLDGEPYRAYYCLECMKSALEKQGQS